MAKAKSSKAKGTSAKGTSAKSTGGKTASAGTKTAPASSVPAISVNGWIAAYGVVALLTFLFHVWIRLGQCEGAANCAFSLLKGLLWALVWPTYWVVYLLSHSPWKGLQGSLGLIG